MLYIASHYGKMFRIKYCADKIKVTVVGSEVDISYFQDVKPWSIYNEVVKVEEDNEHLKQIVSERNQEQKNVDLRLLQGRKSFFIACLMQFLHLNASSVLS